MEQLAGEMWRRTADAWYLRDHAAAATLAEHDHDLDQLHTSLIDELSAGRMAPAVTVELTLLAPLFEHLGDHAVNIAEQIIYIADVGPSVVTRN
jgi:phosphate uptake regulator